MRQSVSVIDAPEPKPQFKLDVDDNGPSKYNHLKSARRSLNVYNLATPNLFGLSSVDRRLVCTAELALNPWQMKRNPGGGAREGLKEAESPVRTEFSVRLKFNTNARVPSVLAVSCQLLPVHVHVLCAEVLRHNSFNPSLIHTKRMY